MKTNLKIGIAFGAGLLTAFLVQSSNANSPSYDAVKLAQYQACLNQVWDPAVNPSDGIAFFINACNYLKP